MVRKKRNLLQRKTTKAQNIRKIKLNELLGKPKASNKSTNKFRIYKSYQSSRPPSDQVHQERGTAGDSDKGPPGKANSKEANMDKPASDNMSFVTVERKQYALAHRDKNQKMTKKKLNCPFCIKSKIGEQINFHSKKNSVKNIITDHFNRIIFENLQINRFQSKNFLWGADD